MIMILLQNQNTLTFENTSTSPDDNNTDVQDTNTDTHSFTVTTDYNLLNVTTRQIEQNNDENQTTSIQYDPSAISTQNTDEFSPPTIFQQSL